MRVKYIGNYYKVSLCKGRVYDVIDACDGWYVLIDETGEEYAFSASQFEILDDKAL